MKNKNYLIRGIVAALVVPLFAMCTKGTNAIETTSSVTPVKSPDAVIVPTFTYTVKTSEWFVDGATFPAGSTVYIPAGKRGALLLKNFKGTAAKPIVIINKGGKVNITVSKAASYAFKTLNCTFFKVLGNGVTSIPYGINISGGNISMTMDGLSSDFEVANVEVRNSGFAGIMAKTDPTCDVSTQRGHFTMKNVILHNNYVHKTGGEGFYVGNSFYAKGVLAACGTVLPHDVQNAKIYNNLVDSTGCEGIQVGSAILGCEVYNNTVKSPGRSPFAAAQNNGIQIGEGTGGKCYNNLVKNAPGNGIIVLGYGDNLICNNYILNSGSYGIFADSRFTPGSGFKFINNTIIASAWSGIRLNSLTIPMNTVINNVIITKGLISAINQMSTKVKLTALNNYIGTDINALKFKNYSSGDFHLLSSSPLINKGLNAIPYGVNSDYYGTVRTAAKIFDIGASEY
jgi:hypothetical protein